MVIKCREFLSSLQKTITITHTDVCLVWETWIARVVTGRVTNVGGVKVLNKLAKVISKEVLVNFDHCPFYFHQHTNL